MYRVFFYAIKGLALWKRITKKFNPLSSKYQVIYILKNELFLIEYVKKYLYTYMHEKNVEQVLFLCSDKKILQELNDYYNGNENIQVQLLTGDEEKNLLLLYRFGQFSERFMLLSLDTYGRKLLNVIGKNGITEEDIFAGGIFTLKLREQGYFSQTREDWSFEILN